MKVAVIGATGFVGQYVVPALCANLSVSLVLASRRRPENSRFPSNAEWVRLDTSEELKRPYEHLGRPDVVIDLAWSGLPNYGSRHHFETQLPEHYRLLASLADEGLAHIVCAGTCLEYGMRNGELHESLAAAPTTAYGFAKDALRRQLQFLQRSCRFELTWARLFYVYGAGQAERSLYPAVMAAIARGDTEFPMSSGDQIRDFIRIEDAADALARLSLRSRGAGVVNICSGAPKSVRSMVEGWVREGGVNLRLIFGKYPYPDYEPLAFWGSREHLDRTLNASLECQGKAHEA